MSDHTLTNPGALVLRLLVDGVFRDELSMALILPGPPAP